MGEYAKTTSVSTDRTIAETRKILFRYGADKFGYLEEEQRICLTFSSQNKQVRFDVPLPDRDSRDFTRTPTGRSRQNAAAQTAWEQACQQRYRAALLIIKAKLEATESGITTFEREFFANLMLPGGKTVFDELNRPVSQAISGSPNTLLQITEVPDGQ